MKTINAVKAKRRQLTLIEVLIVLSIVVMLGGVFAFNIRGPLEDQYFKNDVQKVVERLRLSHQLMLLGPADVELAFNERTMTFKSDDKLDPRINMMVKKEVILKNIDSITLNGHPNPTFLFKSQGSVVTHGTLILKAFNGDTRRIVLNGTSIVISNTPHETETISWDPLIEVTRFEIAPPQSNAS
jgi:hypothetical protein